MSRIGFNILCKACLGGLLLFVAVSCSKYINDDTLIVGGDQYRLHRDYSGHEPGRIRKYTDAGVLYFINSCGPLYSDKTADRYCYYLDFEVFIKEDVFVSGVKIPITEDFSGEEWYNKTPKDFGSINGTKAALRVRRSWDNGIVSKSLYGNSKSFTAINGWIRISELNSSTTEFSAEYNCEVVAYDDGEVMRIHGSIL